MPNRREKYADMELYKKTRRAQRKRNYDQTAGHKRSPWTPEQDKMILEHKCPDRVLSEQTGHSVRAIQVRRSKLSGKREGEEGEIN